MNQSAITVRYAKAFFGLAIEQNTLETINIDMLMLSNVYTNVPEFSILIDSPVIKTSQKREICNHLLQGRVHQTTLTFLNLLFVNKREHYLKDIIRNFFDLYRNEKHIKTVEITSATTLAPEIEKRIVKVIEKHYNVTVELSKLVNKELIGGFILQIGDKQVDSSIATKLTNIKKQLTTIPLDELVKN